MIVANKGEGILEKYASTVANDTINQYNRQVMETASMDLKMPWRRYVGSLKTTSREWCERMVEKKYIHVSELPVLVKGNIDGHQCKIYKKTPENKGTDLPYGLEAGTDAQNVLVRAGGHNCDHSFYPCLESEVPKDILDKFKNKTAEPKKEELKKEVQKPIEQSIKSNIPKEQKTTEYPIKSDTPKEEQPIIDLDNIKETPKLFLDISGGLLPAIGELLSRTRKIITNYEKRQLIKLNELDVRLSNNKSKLYAKADELILEHELETIRKLIATNSDVLFMPIDYFKKTDKKFDVIIFNGNKYFKADLKEIKSKNPDTIADRISYGGTQAGNVVVDIKSDIGYKKLADAVVKATSNNTEIKSIVLFYKNRRKQYYRNSILGKKFVTEFYNDFH